MTPTAVERLLQPVTPMRAADLADLAAGRQLRDASLGAIRLRGRRLSADVADVVVDAVVEQTIRGASTFELAVHDDDHRLVARGFMGQANLDGDGVVATAAGLQWRYRGASTSGSDVTMTFEPEVIAALRGIKRRRVAKRGPNMTRAMFARARVNEVRPRIPFVAPSLNRRVSVEGARRQHGFAPDAGITVKRKRATREQLRNLETVLDVGVQMRAPRKVLLAAIVTITQESVARNLKGGDRDSVGLFQQRNLKPWNRRNRRKPADAARSFFEVAIREYRAAPGLSAAALAQEVQRSAHPRAYAQWSGEAQRTLDAYMEGAGTTGRRDTAYLYSIGPPGGEVGEDYWAGLSRLAEELAVALFEVGGTVYWLTEQEMYAAKPLMTIRRRDEHVESLDFDIDANLKVSEVTLVVRAERWAIPPGCTVEIADEGPADGKWLVETVRRSLVSNLTEVHLVKPAPARPEPGTEQASGQGGPSRVPRPLLSTVRLDTRWGGTQSVFEQVITPFMRSQGLEPGSQKRAYDTVPGPNVSDHATSATRSYAIDYPTTKGERAAGLVATRLGIRGWSANSYRTYTVTIAGEKFEAQVLWGSKIDHADHIHVGLRRL